MKIAFGYLYTDKNATISLEQQEEFIKSYAQNNGFKIIKTYSEYTEIPDLFHHIRKGQFVLIYSNFLITMKLHTIILNELNNLNCVLISCKENLICDSAATRLGSRIMNFVNMYTIDKKLENEYTVSKHTLAEEELKEQIEDELREQIEDELREQIETELRQQIETELRQQIETELRQQIETELRQQIETELSKN